MEIAAFRGRPVQLEFLIEGTKVPGPLPFFGGPVWAVLGPMLFVAAAILAWRNYKLGRADSRGALRLGAFVIATVLLLVFARPIPGAFGAFVELFDSNFAHALYIGLYVVLSYLALEPFVRKRWPRALVSWSRLLAGGIRDPMVGREVLLGAFAILAAVVPIFLLEMGLGALGVELGTPPPILYRGLEGPLQTLANIAGMAGFAVFLAGALVLILVLFRAVFRLPWLANGLWLALAVVADRSREVIPLTTLLFYAIMLLLLSRVGFLAMVVYLLVALVLGNTVPVSVFPSDWYFTQGLVVLVVFGALLGWGYRAATEGRSLFEAPAE